MGTDHVAAYDRQSERLAAEYESLDPTDYRETYAALLRTGTDLVALDVGAGSGRDAAWLAELGFEVVAAEPAAGMREAGRRFHAGTGIRWLDDRLPTLDATHALGLAFDVVLLSAVWQHVAPGDRSRAFRKLVTLMKPGGLLVVTLRFGPAPPDRPMHEVSLGEMEGLAREHGLAVVRVERDARRGKGVNWITVAMILPDDGAGALPLLRGIILNDDKVRDLQARAAACGSQSRRPHARPRATASDRGRRRAAAGGGRPELGAYVSSPRVARHAPDAPQQRPGWSGFAKEGFRALMGSGLTPIDLRVGSTFSGERALAVAGALREAARTVATMPVNFTRYPNSETRVFEASVTGPRLRGALALDADTLSAFGSLRVPGHIWRAMQRLGTWIEPVLSAEWARMVRGYAESQGRALAAGEVEAALTWIEPTRDVRVAREVALARIAAGEAVRCVWSDRLLTQATLDVDHCLPWSAWACGDLWNLMPAHRTVNQQEKRDRLPSAAALAMSRSAIIDWWDGSWSRDVALRARFSREVGATLPVQADSPSDQVFEGLSWRRLRLQQDQRLVEWDGCAR